MSYAAEEIQTIDHHKMTASSNIERIDIEEWTTLEEAQQMWDESYAALCTLGEALGVELS